MLYTRELLTERFRVVVGGRLSVRRKPVGFARRRRFGLGGNGVRRPLLVLRPRFARVTATARCRRLFEQVFDHAGQVAGHQEEQHDEHDESRQSRVHFFSAAAT